MKNSEQDVPKSHKKIVKQMQGIYDQVSSDKKKQLLFNELQQLEQKIKNMKQKVNILSHTYAVLKIKCQGVIPPLPDFPKIHIPKYNG